MNRRRVSMWLVGVCLLRAFGVYGQVQRPNRGRAGDEAATVQRPVEPDSSATSTAVAAGPQAVVPRLMKFSGVLHDTAGKPLVGAVDVTFSLYNTESGGSPLWFETQSVQADELGRYTALLGAMHADGLPIDLFTSGEVRWLGIQVGTEAEQQPRVLLVSVPYALKAGDAETLGGKPASAYMLSETQSGTASTTATLATRSGTPQAGTGGKTRKSQSTSKSPLTACSSVTSDGTAAPNSITLFTTACNIQSANLVQFNGNLGFGTTTPQARLHIFGPDNTDSDARFNFILGDSTPATAGTGGGILFSGYYNGTTSKAGFANIRGIKENSIQGNYATAMVFDTRANGGNQTERMRISSAGYLGIGTTTPAATLEVNGTAKFDQAVTFAQPITTSGLATFSAGNATEALDVTQSSTGAAAVLNNTGGGPILTGEQSGTPVFTVANSGGITSTGLVTQPSLTNGSDTSANVVAGYFGSSGKNTITAGITGATIAGGGGVNGGSPAGNSVGADFGTVGGGSGNSASGGDHATVSGGMSNAASGTWATVAGGAQNNASGAGAFIAGGNGNSAAGLYGTVLGGNSNSASGTRSVVVGGATNTASGFLSFAAGCAANAAHLGAFVWSDGTCTATSSTANNQFIINATGGVGIGTNAPMQPLDVAGTTAIRGELIADALNGNNGAVNDGTPSGRGLTFGASSGEGIASKRTAGGNQYGLDFYTSFANRMAITQGGNVGIGTTAPQYALDVNGSVHSANGRWWVTATDSQSTTSTSLVQVPDLILSGMQWSGLPVLIQANIGGVEVTNTFACVYFEIVQDSTTVLDSKEWCTNDGSTGANPVTTIPMLTFIASPSAGSHSIAVNFDTNSGSTAYVSTASTNRSLFVAEM